jgi:hypothetical protein
MGFNSGLKALSSTDITITMHGGTMSPDSCNASWRSLVVCIVPKRLGHIFFSDKDHNVSETLCCCTQILYNYNLNATTVIIFPVGN